MYQIRNTSQKILEKMLGMNYQEIMDMDYEEGISYIQKKNCKRLIFPNQINHRTSRHENYLLSRGRIKTIDQVEKGLSKILRKKMNDINL